jgi:hypothetical protein
MIVHEMAVIIVIRNDLVYHRRVLKYGTELVFGPRIQPSENG